MDITEVITGLAAILRKAIISKVQARGSAFLRDDKNQQASHLDVHKSRNRLTMDN